jgi:ribose 5-phosphate isomerase B
MKSPELKTNKPAVIAIGCDHAGYPFKSDIIRMMLDEGYEVLDMGTDSSESVDYPDFVHPVAESIENNTADRGVLICGTGNGVAITANKHAEIRAAVCWNEALAKLARQHNDANVIAIPARFIKPELAVHLVKIFLGTGFEGGRHKRRVNKISQC